MNSMPKSSRGAARAVAEGTRLYSLSVSLGGVESLICYPSEMTHASVQGTALAVPTFLMFANDHKGFLPQVGSATGSEAFTIDGVSYNVLVRWFGGLYGTPQKFYAPASMLAKYWGTASVGGCPAGRDFEPSIGWK